jgi:sulfur-carrier protein
MTSATDTRPVTVMYFAWVREKVGVAREEIVLPGSVATVADLIGWLSTRGPHYANAFARPEIIRTAINQVHVKATASLASAHEIAFFPPVTGG